MRATEQELRWDPYGQGGHFEGISRLKSEFGPGSIFTCTQAYHSTPNWPASSQMPVSMNSLPLPGLMPRGKCSTISACSDSGIQPGWRYPASQTRGELLSYWRIAILRHLVPEPQRTGDHRWQPRKHEPERIQPSTEILPEPLDQTSWHWT